MNAPATVPVTVTPEAAEHIAALGVQAEFEQMLEHTRRTVVGVDRIDVWLQPPYDTGEHPGVILQATRAGSAAADAAAEWDWGAWKVKAFAPDVSRHFVMLIVGEATNAR